MRKVLKLTALTIGLLAFGSTAFAAPALTLSDVQVTASYKDEGSPSCTLRLATPKGQPTLALQGRTSKTSETPQAFFILGALSPYLAGKKGTIRDIRLTAGRLHAAGLKGAWSLGSTNANSSLAIDTRLSLVSSLPYLKAGGAMSVSFDLANRTYKFAFSLAGTGQALPFFQACMRA